MDPDHQFPPNFIWGAATSSHQVEGNNIHNDWWDWEQRGLIREPSGRACDHWNLFREDFKLAKSLGHNAHRFSIEWSRIEPEEGRFNEEALAHYRTVIETLRRECLEPIVTLHHFTLPLWLAKKGGWLSKESPGFFVRYAKKVVESIGENVTYWVTINEPEVYVFKSYWMGEWPPGQKSYDHTYFVITHLLKAHVLAYAAIHELSRVLGRKAPMIGIAKHMSIFTPCNVKSWKDRMATWLRDLAFNHLFIRALIQGRIFYPGLFKIKLPHMNALDFIGLNYYTRGFISYKKGLVVPDIFGDACETGHHHASHVRYNTMKWEIYPEGLYLLVKDLSKYRLPILITENGICAEDDSERARFIREHLAALLKAMNEGAPVIGYLYWSLLDNFEWAEGFGPRFGLIEVDYNTQKRTIRNSARGYSQICKSGKLV